MNLDIKNDNCPEIAGDETAGVNSGLSIGALSEQTGVPVETIRIWERRHGVLSPRRSPGRHRRFTQEDIERVAWLAQRVATGQRISDAVAALRALGREGSTTSGETLCELLSGAALRSDAGQVERDLGRAFRLFPLVEALELVVFPALAELSTRWVAGEPTIAAEHLLSEAVTRHLSMRLKETRWLTATPIAIFCPSDEHHEIGALALAVLASDDGSSVAYFGSNTPIDEVARLVAARHVRHAVAVCTMPERATETLDFLDRHTNQDAGWSVTGPAVHGTSEGARARRNVVGPDLDSARQQLRAVSAARTRHTGKPTT